MILYVYIKMFISSKYILCLTFFNFILFIAYFFNKWIIKNKNDFFLLKNDHCILASKRLSKKYKFNISVLKFLYQSWTGSISPHY